MRGVAVLLVLVYHCTFSVFQGGYVGVDVFFVISGYLITRILLHDLENNSFSIRDFYVRRIRRLIPALVVTTALTVLAGMVILSPKHLRELGVSSIFTTLSLSNFHFTFSTGYFETSSKIKPLLHTWSLGVEEQFYLFWPVSLWFAIRALRLRPMLLPLIGIAAVCGLLLSEYWIGRNPTQAYFLLPFRIHQFLIGALAVMLERRLPTVNSLAATIVCVVGLAAILLGAVIFDEQTRFPGFASLAPAMGAFLVILAGEHSPIAKRILGFSMLAWVGRLSYSIYLAHWPVIAYARYLSAEPTFGMAEKWTLLAISVVMGALLHHGVETRFRLAGPGRRWVEARGIALASIVAILISGGLVWTQGLAQRMNLVPAARNFAGLMQFDFTRDYQDGLLHVGAGTSGKKVLMFGDSMMQNYVPALMSLPEMQMADVTIATRGGCVEGWGALRVVNGGVDRNCRSLRDSVFRNASRYDLIIWSQNWLGYPDTLYLENATGAAPITGSGATRWREIIKETLTRLGRQSRNIVIIGPPLTIEGVPEMLERIGPITDLEHIPAMLTQMTETGAALRDRGEQQLRAIAGDSLVIDPRALICSEGKCRLHDRRLSYYLDSIHFTAAMTPILAPLMRKELGAALSHITAGGGGSAPINRNSDVSRLRAQSISSGAAVHAHEQNHRAESIIAQPLSGPLRSD